MATTKYELLAIFLRAMFIGLKVRTTKIFLLSVYLLIETKKLLLTKKKTGFVSTILILNAVGLMLLNASTLKTVK